MSLYHEAAKVLDTASKQNVSLKSVVFVKKDWKNDAKTLFALSTEAAKWSKVLSEVVEKSGILKAEKHLTPTLALLLTHDLLLSRKGIALPRQHGLHVAIIRHKARLAAELTKTKLRLGFAGIDSLRQNLDQHSAGGDDQPNDGTQSITRRPRWIRINTLRTTLEEQLKTTFGEYKRVQSLRELTGSHATEKLVYIDEHVPNLIAVSTHTSFSNSSAYKDGKLILQDKASCFPAYLLDPSRLDGDLVDACAAPGNKTTHLAALLADSQSEQKPSKRRIFACEKDAERSKTLEKMVKLASADDITLVKARQDFLKINPHSSEFAKVSGLLLDPSCSGSGIVERDGASVTIHLPNDQKTETPQSGGKKRKRGEERKAQEDLLDEAPIESTVEESTSVSEPNSAELYARLTALSAFQSRLLEHAMCFPAARRITYSTCSVHDEENEHVVIRALLSDTARERNWRIMEQGEQVEGLKKWHKRGKLDAFIEAMTEAKDDGIGLDAQMVTEACIRCEKDSEDGTMGFFVAALVRDIDPMQAARKGDSSSTRHAQAYDVDTHDGAEDEWAGFSDDER